MARKTVKIREDQDEWVEENNINFSSLVRDLLDDEIEQRVPEGEKA